MSTFAREIELSLLVNQQGEEINKLLAENESLRAAIPEGCTPADARVLREANHRLVAEIDRLHMVIDNIVKTERAFGANDFADAIEQQASAALRGEVE